MTAIFGQIIDGFKSFLSKLEEMARYAVSELEKYSSEAAQKIQVLMAAELRNIKNKISQLIKTAKNKLENIPKQRIQTFPGPAGASFGKRLRNALSSATRTAEGVANKFKESTVSLMKEVKEILSRLSDTLLRGTSGLEKLTKDATTGIFNALKNIGEGAIKEVKGFTESFAKDLEIVSNFVHKHGLQIAEAATITVLSPTLVLGTLGAAGVIILSHREFIAPLEKSPPHYEQIPEHRL
jgi:hypothetical protein